MSDLYPLKFEPVLKERIWGGDALVKRYGKKGDSLSKFGESWEISGVSGNLSVVSNGFLAGNNIEELIEVYLGDITGESVYEKFGIEFPLLIKLIEARTDLSIQVHPGNALARERHNAYGKTEMWYILEGDGESRIYTGFAEPITKELYLDALREDRVAELLNVEKAEPGDAFYTPSGRVHAIGAGTLLVEIQQTSDITYRIYDWGRNDAGGKSRDLHTDLALDAIDFSASGKNKIRKELQPNKTETLVSCEFFTVNILNFNKRIARDYNLIDSFVIYFCVVGKFRIRWEENTEVVTRGETILLPALIREVILEPEPSARILEIYIDTLKVNN